MLEEAWAEGIMEMSYDKLEISRFVTELAGFTVIFTPSSPVELV